VLSTWFGHWCLSHRLCSIADARTLLQLYSVYNIIIMYTYIILVLRTVTMIYFIIIMSCRVFVGEKTLNTTIGEFYLPVQLRIRSHKYSGRSIGLFMVNGMLITKLLRLSRTTRLRSKNKFNLFFGSSLQLIRLVLRDT